MKNALSSFLGGGKEDPTAGAAGTAAPPYEGDFKLAGEEGDDVEEGGGALEEVKSLLEGASEDQLMQIKGILTAPKEGSETSSAGIGTGASTAPGMGSDLGSM